MIKKLLYASLAVVGLFGLALVVAAQGPGPRGRQNFAGGGMMGGGMMGGPGHFARGIPACAKANPANCPVYQFNWTRTIKRPVLASPSNPNATPITITSSGVLAGDNFGSTYYQVTVTPVGPWASKAGPQEFIYVRDLDTMLSYIQNVTKNTYQQFTIKAPTTSGTKPPNPNWKGPGSGSGNGPTITKTSVNGTSYGGFTCQSGEMTTITAGSSVTHRVFCADLHILVEEDSSSPQSSSTYTLAGYTPTLSGTLPFTPSGTPVPAPKFDHHGHRPGGHKPPPAATPPV